MQLRADLQAAVSRAGLLATTHGHASITAEHLLASLLADDGVARVITGVGGDVAKVMASAVQMVDALDPRVRNGGFLPPIVATDVLKRALVQVAANGGGDVTPVDAFIAIYGPPVSRASQLLATAGVDRLRALLFIEHGIARDPAVHEAPADTLRNYGAHGPADVTVTRKIVLHNDRYTTMEYVIEALQSFFDLTADDAKRLMLAVHREGKATVAVDAKATAELRVASFLSHARAHGMPLLVTSEPAERD
jgi:ATP-dependent Clp protease adaptor protein ClpS